MKTVIAGLGSIGRRHLRNLAALGEHEILLLRTGRSTLPDADLAGIPSVTDLQDALDWQPDAFIISNPTSLHLDIAIPAAEAGCTILLEKPVSHSMERVSDLRESLNRGQGQVLVGFQYRFHPGLKKVEDLLRQEMIGKPLSVRAHWSQWLPGWHPYEDYRSAYSARADLGGGVVLTLCHPLDYLRWLFGDIQELWAFTGKLNDLQIDVEDTAEIGLKFKNNIIGSVHLDYNGQPSAHYMEVVGSHGTLRWDNNNGTVYLYSLVQPVGLAAAGLAAQHGVEAVSRSTSSSEMQGWQIFPAPPGFERNELFIAEMRHFIEIVRRDTLPVCSLEDGIIALELALAALESARTGQIIKF